MSYFPWSERSCKLVLQCVSYQKKDEDCVIADDANNDQTVQQNTACTRRFNSRVTTPTLRIISQQTDMTSRYKYLKKEDIHDRTLLGSTNSNQRIDKPPH